MSRRALSILVLAVIVFPVVFPVVYPVLVVNSSSTDPLSKIHPVLLKKLEGLKGDDIVEVVVRLTPLPKDVKLQVKGNYRLAVNALKSWAEQTQKPVISWVNSMGGVVLNSFWLDNVILVRVPVKLVYEIAKHPSVVWIFENFEVRIIEPVYREPTFTTQQVSSWGIFKIRAPEVWALGYTGEGIRIAVLDTGVDITHPALAGKMLTVIPGDPYYPGGWMEFDSAGNPVRSTPRDTDGHGTHVSGTALGGDTSNILIGVAPGATLMHGLVLPGGGGTFAQVLAGMQWTVEPFYLTPGGDRVYTGLPAHVVSMSFGANEYYGNELLPAIEAMLLANIVPVAAIGNAGPGTTGNPGNIWGVFGIGATDINDNVASWSSGKVVTWPSPPATWPFFDMYPSTYIKPDFSAPGVSITSAVPGGGYEAWSGTSMATPHVSGIVALMLQAAGWFYYDVPDIPEKIYLALNATAIDYGAPGQDTRYGWGRVDAYEAVRKAMEYAKKSGVEGFVRDRVSGEPIPWVTVTVLETGTTYKVNASGYYRIPLDPGIYTLVFSAWGYENITVQVEVVLLNGTITGVVSDAISGAPIAGANVTVVELNLTVVTNENGIYEVSVPPGRYTLTAVATGYQPATETVYVDEGEVVIVNFNLYPLGNGTIAGYVYDASTNTTLSNVLVWTYVNNTTVYTYTDENGYYELSVPSGTYTVYAWKPGYSRAEIPGVVVKPGQVTQVNIYLTPIPPTVVVLANVHYRTQPHLKTIVENLGLPVVEYNDMDVLLQDWLDGVINPKVIIIDHTKSDRFSYPSESTVVAFHLLADAYGTTLIWLGTSYSGYTGIDVLYQYGTTLPTYGYPAPITRAVGYPSPSYVQVEMLNPDHPIFSGVQPDVPNYPNRFYLGTGSYVDYAIYNFTDPTGRFTVLGYVWDTRYTNSYGVGVAEWVSSSGVPWYYLGSWAESYWMQYLEPGADGMYTENTKKVLENAVLLGWSAQPTRFDKVVFAKVLYYILSTKRVEISRDVKPHLYTRVDVLMDRLPHGFVEGRVIGSDGSILAGAKVKVLGTPVTVYTNGAGRFHTWLPEGSYTLEISYPGYATKYVGVVITVNETVNLGDIVLRRVPRVAIMWDYAGSLKQFFESKGWYAQSYTDLSQLTSDILAGIYDLVIYSGDYGVPFPTADQFNAFLQATFTKRVGVIWMDSWGAYGYGIKVLNRYLGDPPSIGYSWGYPVYIVVTKPHPILRGYSVGDVVPIVTYSSADFSWFTGFSGEAIADTLAGGVVWGNAIAWKVFDNGVKWVLLSSFAPTSWNTPNYFTQDAWNIIYNAAVWAISRPLSVELENPYLHVGDTATLYIVGAPMYTQLYIYLGGELIGVVETDESGSAVFTFKVPLMPGGEYIVEVMTEDTLYYGYTKLYVLPKVVVTPTVITAPGTVFVEATGLASYQPLYIYLDGNFLSLYKANASGAFNIKLNIPLVGEGAHEIIILDPETGDVLASATIYVTSKLDQAIATLDAILARANEINARIAAITGDIATIVTRLGTIEVRISDLLARADQLGLKIDTVLGDTAIIKSRLGDLEVKISTILDNLDVINATITGIRGDTVHIRSKLGDLEVRISDLLARADQLGLKIDTVLGDTVVIKSSLGTLEVKINTILGNLDKINATIIGIREDTVYIKTKLGDLEVGINAILARADELGLKIDTVLGDTAVIKSSLGTLEVKIDTILRNLGSLNATIVDIHEGIAYVRTNLGGLGVDITSLMKALKATNATLTELIVTSRGEIIGVINTVNGNIRAMNDALITLLNNKLPVDTNTLMVSIRSDIQTLNTVVMDKLSQVLDQISSVKDDTTKISTVIDRLRTIETIIDTKSSEIVSTLTSKIDEKAKTLQESIGTASTYSMGGLVVAVIILIALIALQFIGRGKIK